MECVKDCPAFCQCCRVVLRPGLQRAVSQDIFTGLRAVEKMSEKIHTPNPKPLKTLNPKAKPLKTLNPKAKPLKTLKPKA